MKKPVECPITFMKPHTTKDATLAARNVGQILGT
jgi:hypothetical protein